MTLVGETLEDLKESLGAWKGALETKELRVNVNLTKIIICGENNRKVEEKGKFPCTVCRKGVGSICIYGLAGTSRYWYLRVKEELTKLNGHICPANQGNFIWHHNNQLTGIITCFADDI